MYLYLLLGGDTDQVRMLLYTYSKEWSECH